MRLMTRLALAAVLAAGAAAAALAQGSYPSQGVKIVVPFGAGSITDTTARVLADKLQAVWGQSVVVENRPGLPGTTAVAKAAPDGYTLMLTSSGHTVAKAVNANVTFDPVKDFVGITRAVTAPFIMIVPPELPANNLKELIDLVKSKPGTMNFSSAGVTSTTFLAGEIFRQMADLKMTHVPFKGVPEAITAVLRNDVQFYFAPVSDARELVDGKKVKAIAASSAKRVPQFPDLPTVGETLKGYEYEGWFGVMAPAATPRAVIDKVNKDIIAVLNAPEMKERLLKQGSLVAADTPAQFDDIIKADTDRFTKVLEAAGVKAGN